jgi:hypothetical protein
MFRERRCIVTELLVVVGLIAGIVAAHEIGFLLGRRTRSTDEAFDRQLALIRNFTAALVAFLIGFAFSGAGNRYVDRLDIIVKEANALGTAHLRADTMAEPERSALKAAIKEYTSDRIDLLSGDAPERIAQLLAKVGSLHQRMWQAAVGATRGNAPLMAVVLPPVNEVIDLHTMHLAMARRHLPFPILAMMLGTVAITSGLVGFGNGRVGRRFAQLDSVYGVVLIIALLMVIDLDYPGQGLIRVSNRVFVEALAAMK